MDNNRTFLDGIWRYSKINSMIWIALYLSWIITDVLLVFFPDIYTLTRSVFKFATMVVFAALYMARSNNIDTINTLKSFLKENPELRKKVKTKYYLRNFIAILFLLASFVARLMVRIYTDKPIYILIATLLLGLTQAIIVLFTNSMIKTIEKHI